MAHMTSQVESDPTPSIKSLKSRFERLALDSTSSNTLLKPTTASLSTPVHPQGHTAVAPNLTPILRPRTGPSPAPNSGTGKSQSIVPVCDVRNKTSASDLKATALKRPPPPPPPGIKKPPSSPIASPLLRPVPAPVTLRSPSASPEPDSQSLRDYKNHGIDEGGDDGSLVSVASLRNRFSSSTSIQLPKSSFLSRPPVMTSRSDPGVIEHAPPIIPPRCTTLGVSELSQSPSFDVSTERSLSSVNDASSRTGNVAAIRDRFAFKDVTKLHLDDVFSSRSELNILVTSPPPLPTRRSAPRAPQSALFTREDSLDLPSSPNSSLLGPFSDGESEISEISEVALSPAGPPRKTSSFGESTYAQGIHCHHHERKHSSSSSESHSSISPSKPKPPSRPAPPPRPPRRPNGSSIPPGPLESSSATTTPMRLAPPPLPSRRVSQDNVPEVLSPLPPLPARQSLQAYTVSPAESASPRIGERKPFGSAKLPPPPTRTIGLGDKLPPVRRARSLSSDEESGSEGDPRLHGAELLPDSSRSSRRPPSLPSDSLMEYKIHVPAHSGHVAVTRSGVVVASGHHIRYYELSSGGGSSWMLDTKESMRGALVSCLELRSGRNNGDSGQYLWVGTKEGHLLEVDVGMGVFTASKMGIHASQVTSIFRHGFSMITVDETGKTLIFEPSSNASVGIGAGAADDVHLAITPPRVYRLGERAEFMKMLGGLLWTSSRTDVNGAGTTSVPVIRIYDIFAPGSVGRVVTPTHHAGAVTSGTILPSQCDHVFLGHEGGFITIWNIVTDDGIPTCEDVVKVSASDVLCLEGVNDRLWVGGRKGTIAVYDVSVKPWVVTNSWDAHGSLPVSRIFVDPYAVVFRGKLSVVSVGRDEQIRFWDGLLGADQIEQELVKREHSFSTFRDIKVLIVSWNVDATKPESLSGDPENVRFLQDVLTSVDSPDIISFGFQEVIDLESRKMAAKTVLLGGKKKGDEGKINEKVTSSYKKWHDRLIQAVRLAMPPESPYTVVHTESLVGLLTCVFVKNTVRASLRDVAITTLKRGMGGHYGNKGGIIARFVIDDTSLCFVNCHLAAGQHHVRQRNADIAAFLEESNVFSADSVDEIGYVGGGDGSMVLDHEIVFLNGDMNYRIDQRRDAVIAAIEANDLDALITHDQLRKEMKHNRAFRLRTFHEGPLTFAPTYKYDRHSNVFDTSEKRRVPAWCDRVLWRSREKSRVALLEYRRWEPNVSDHRPVSAAFRVTVKKVVEELRDKERAVLVEWWSGLEKTLLRDAKKFYECQVV